MARRKLHGARLPVWQEEERKRRSWVSDDNKGAGGAQFPACSARWLACLFVPSLKTEPVAVGLGRARDVGQAIRERKSRVKERGKKGPFLRAAQFSWGRAVFSQAASRKRRSSHARLRGQKCVCNEISDWYASVCVPPGLHEREIPFWASRKGAQKGRRLALPVRLPARAALHCRPLKWCIGAPLQSWCLALD